jgi:hypothetical protein
MPFAQLIHSDELIAKSVTAIVVFVVSTVLSFLIGRFWGRYLAQRAWRKKQFLGRILVSLNSFTDGYLKIRTVFERSLEEVFLNPIAIELVRAASLQTTVDNPMLPIAPKDRWFLLNFVLNAVAERFSDGLVRYDAGESRKPVVYMLFLTCEMVGEDRIHKVRAMMLRKDLLLNFPYHESLPQLEKDYHADRIVTLRRAAELYRKEPDNFLPLEIYV